MKIVNILKKNVEYACVSIFIYSYLYIKIAYYCRLFTSIDFDSQALFMWDYIASKGYFPYRDVYYPYGTLYFFKNTNTFFNLLFIFVLSALFLSIFVYLKKLWRNFYFTYGTFISFLVFVDVFTGYDTFGRYGVLMSFILVYTSIFFQKNYVSSKIIFLIGLLNGFVFSLLYDQALYSVVFFVLILLIDYFLANRRAILNKNNVCNLGRKIIVFWCGISIGTLPFLIFLYLSNSLHQFVLNITTVQDLTIYAKTPFFPYSTTPDNLFTYAVLLVGLFYITHKIFLKPSFYSNNFYTILYLILALLFLEQKNIIRSISGQLTFISFFVLILLGHEFYKLLIKYKISSIYIGIYYLVVFIILANVTGLEKNSSNFIKRNNSLTCVEENRNFLTSKYKQLTEVKNFINVIKKTNENVYSYPGNPVFYIVFDSPFPYYFSTYEASPQYAQEKRIDFLKKSKYVVVDLSTLAIQDNVPEYTRSSKELKFLINSFHLLKKIKNFLIFERNKTDIDFFTDSSRFLSPELNRYLLKINLMAIPRSEGIYKSQKMKEEKARFNFNSEITMNEYLRSNRVNSHDLLMYLHVKKMSKKNQNTSLLIASNGIQTQVSFVTNQNDQNYILNFSDIPLFFKDRYIDNVTINPEGLYDISFYNRNQWQQNHIW